MEIARFWSGSLKLETHSRIQRCRSRFSKLRATGFLGVVTLWIAGAGEGDWILTGGSRIPGEVPAVTLDSTKKEMCREVRTFTKYSRDEFLRVHTERS